MSEVAEAEAVVDQEQEVVEVQEVPDVPKTLAEGVETSGETEAATETAGEVAIPEDVNEKINAKIARHKHEARRAKEDATYWRNQAQGHNPAPQAPAAPQAPSIDQFENYDDYVGATIDYRAEQKFNSLQKNHTEQQQQAAYQSKKQSVISQGNSAHEDFYDVTSTIPLSEIAMATATELKNGSEAMYFLGKNKAEAERIYSLTPVQQVIEINNISQKLSAPAVKQATTAPDPITPVTTAGPSGALKYHPNMSDTDFNKMRRQQKKR